MRFLRPSGGGGLLPIAYRHYGQIHTPWIQFTQPPGRYSCCAASRHDIIYQDDRSPFVLPPIRLCQGASTKLNSMVCHSSASRPSGSCLGHPRFHCKKRMDRQGQSNAHRRCQQCSMVKSPRPSTEQRHRHGNDECRPLHPAKHWAHSHCQKRPQRLRHFPPRGVLQPKHEFPQLTFPNSKPDDTVERARLTSAPNAPTVIISRHRCSIGRTGTASKAPKCRWINQDRLSTQRGPRPANPISKQCFHAAFGTQPIS